ncbi:hypothetical protein CLOP_g2878 [Closterium sp. NIES-67]|nr:hypothetical protein CLOP_g2878 [Closterium sp. NIES-67]
MASLPPASDATTTATTATTSTASAGLQQRSPQLRPVAGPQQRSPQMRAAMALDQPLLPILQPPPPDSTTTLRSDDSAASLLSATADGRLLRESQASRNSEDGRSRRGHSPPAIHASPPPVPSRLPSAQHRWPLLRLPARTAFLALVALLAALLAGGSLLLASSPGPPPRDLLATTSDTDERPAGDALRASALVAGGTAGERRTGNASDGDPEGRGGADGEERRTGEKAKRSDAEREGAGGGEGRESKGQRGKERAERGEGKGALEKVVAAVAANGRRAGSRGSESGAAGSGGRGERGTARGGGGADGQAAGDGGETAGGGEGVLERAEERRRGDGGEETGVGSEKDGSGGKGGGEAGESDQMSKAKRGHGRRGEREADVEREGMSSNQKRAQGTATDTMTQRNVTQRNVTQRNVTQGSMTQGNVAQGNVTQRIVTQGNVTQGNVKQHEEGTAVADGASAEPLAAAGPSAASRALHPTCDLSRGEWVPASSPPLYSGATCPWLSPQWACRKAKDRPSFAHEGLQWRPADCDLPAFDPVDFLQRMQHRAVAIVGDSLGQQQFQSLLCLLASAALPAGTEDVAGEWGFVNIPVSSKYKRLRPTGYAVRFTATNTTVAFSWSSCLCKIAYYNMSDMLEGGAAMHVDQPDDFLSKHLGRLDVVLMNSAHHWSRHKLRESKWDVHIAGQPVNVDDPSLHLDVHVNAPLPPQTHQAAHGNSSSGNGSSSEGKAEGVQGSSEKSSVSAEGSTVHIEGNADVIHTLQRIALRSTMAWLHRQVAERDKGGEGGEGRAGGEGGEDGSPAAEGDAGSSSSSSGQQRRPPLLLLRTASPRHFFDGEWNTRGHCDHKREPLSLAAVLPLNSSRDPPAEAAVAGLPSLHLLNASHLSSFRADAHPSQWGYLLDAAHQDCLHWCMPGVPDTWNQLLYAHMLMRDMQQGGGVGEVRDPGGGIEERAADGGVEIGEEHGR